MNDNLTGWTSVLLLQMFDQTTFAKRVQALGHSSRVDQIPPTYFARYVTVQSFQFYFPLHLSGQQHLLRSVLLFHYKQNNVNK